MAELTFQSIGGAWHLKIDGEDALAHIHEVNPARWVVTSIPVVDLQCDAGFIAFMDPEKKGRILVNRLIESRDWLYKHLKGRSRLAAKVEELRLEDIDTSSTEGEGLRRVAERILRERGAADTKSISLSIVREYRKGYAKLLANGDGVLSAATVPEEEVAQLIKDILATTGGVPEACGEPGAGMAQLEKFLAQGKAWLDWKQKGTGTDGLPSADIFPWGEETAGCAAMVRGLEAKLEQFFAQCDLVKEDPTQAAKFRAAIAALDNAGAADPAAIATALAAAPISEPNPDGLLAADAKLNPFYEKAINDLRTKVLARALGADSGLLNRDAWARVKGVFAPFWAWQAAKPAEPFESIDEGRLKGYLAAPPVMERFKHFVDLDLAAAPEVAQLANLEKLVLYQRWLLEFANNFVNLSALYNPRVRTLFEMGTMVIDGRRLEFTLRVVNRAEHKKVATEGRIFLVYAAIYDDPAKPALYEVAAPVTKGERGRLIPGKRGVFYTVDGKVYDAVIVDIAEHPISIIEAVKAPFRRTAEFISKKIEEFAAARAAKAEAAAQARALQSVEDLSKTHTAKPEEQKKTDPAAIAGVAATAGIALAALGSAIAFIISALAKITFLDAVLAIASIIGLIALLAGFLGWLKLRLRNMGPVFEANGWAVNPRMKVNGPLARIFTRHPGLPKGHVKDVSVSLAVSALEDDEEPEGFSWPRFFLLLAIGIAVAYAVAVAAYPELLWPFGRK